MSSEDYHFVAAWLALLGGTVAAMCAGAGAVCWISEKLLLSPSLEEEYWRCEGWSIERLGGDGGSRARQSWLQEMPDRELVGLMGDVVQESRRRRRGRRT